MFRPIQTNSCVTIENNMVRHNEILWQTSRRRVYVGYIMLVHFCWDDPNNHKGPVMVVICLLLA